MTSFVNMFLPARYTCNDKIAVEMCRAQFGKCPSYGRLEEEQQSCKSQIKIKVRTFQRNSLQCHS